MTRKMVTTVLTFACVMCWTMAASAGQAGAPDPSFSDDGWLPVDFGGDSALTAVAVVDGGQRIVAAGAAFGGTVGVVRLGLDGAPDLGFGTWGQTTFTVPGATGAEVVRIVEAPGGGYLLLVQATGSGESVGYLVRLTEAGALDTGFANGGFEALLASWAPRPVADIEVRPATDELVYCGNDQWFVGGSNDAIMGSLDLSSLVRLGVNHWGSATADDVAAGVATVGWDGLVVLYRDGDSPSRVRAVELNNVGNIQTVAPVWYEVTGATVDPVDLERQDPWSLVSASWVSAGLSGRPALVNGWSWNPVDGVQPRAGFGSAGSLLLHPALNLAGYDALRPARVRTLADGEVLLAATELGGPTGPQHRVVPVVVDADGRLVLQGAGLVGPDAGRDHQARDLAVLPDGRMVIAVTTLDRANPFDGNGWLLITQSHRIFSDGFESGDLGAW